MERNWSYTIPDGEHEGITLWSGRYCTVCAIVLCRAVQTDNRCWKWYILANKRGIGAPDFKGYWNLPCGFIEKGETGEQAASRETLEETGVFRYPTDFKFLNADTDPSISNNGNITLNYTSIFQRNNLPTIKSGIDTFGSEINEVAEVKWIPIDDIDNYKWAFHHKELIDKTIYEEHLKTSC